MIRANTSYLKAYTHTFDKIVCMYAILKHLQATTRKIWRRKVHAFKTFDFIFNGRKIEFSQKCALLTLFCYLDKIIFLTIVHGLILNFLTRSRDRENNANGLISNWGQTIQIYKMCLCVTLNML